MREMLMRSRAAGAPGLWHVGDLTWRYFLMTLRANPANDIRLWHDAQGNLAGFAAFDPSNGSCDWQLRPEARWQGIEDGILEWFDACAATIAPAEPGQKPRSLIGSAFEDDPERIACLERHGYRPYGSGYVHFSRSLLKPIPEPELPNGFRLRGVAGKHEAARRASVHREAFYPSRVSDEGYLRFMDLPGYERNLDVVVVAPDEEFAAFSMAWVDEVNRVGEFEPVGTRPTYRRLGLAHAVQLEGLQRMQAAGADTASVATWADSEPAIALYKSVGFEIVNHELEYSKTL
jgi:ribosomal protein S18 acetylase RimI-like enzyme